MESLTSRYFRASEGRIFRTRYSEATIRPIGRMPSNAALGGGPLPEYYRPMAAEIHGYPDAERACWLDFLVRAPDSLRSGLGIAWHARGEHLAFRVGALSHLALNRLVGLYHPPLPAAADLDAALGFFQDQGERRFLVQLPEGSELEGIRAHLAARGLEPYRRRWVSYERDASPIEVPAHDFPIVEAMDEHRTAIGNLLCAAFDCRPEGAALFSWVVGRPSWCVKVALDESREVMGVGMMFIHGASAYLAFGATAPRFRRRGVQGALMAARIQEAIARGCTEISTETGEAMPGEPNPSGNNMLRSGFRPVRVSDNWTLPGTTWLAP